MTETKTMKIKTRDFGECDIAADAIISFPKGIFAFENVNRYTVLSPIENDGAPHWLQNCEDSQPCFIVFKIEDIISNYIANPLQEDLDLIDYKKGDKLEYYCIAVIPDDYRKTTVNLKCPVIINKSKKLGVQAILPQNYEIKYSLYKEEEK